MREMTPVDNNLSYIFVFGATGLVGRDVVRQLLESSPSANSNTIPFDKVLAVCRRPVPLEWWSSDERLEVHVIQEPAIDAPYQTERGIRGWLDALKSLPWHQCEMVYCCVGTTIRKAGSQAAFWHVDVRMVEAIANLSAQYGVKRLCAVSSVGASASSLFFYSRAKAAMEQSLAVSGLPMVHIVRPTLLLGDRQEHRSGERIAIWISERMPWIFNGPLQKQKPIHAAQVARAMIGLMNEWPEVPVPTGFDPQPGGVFFHEATTLHQWTK